MTTARDAAPARRLFSDAIAVYLKPRVLIVMFLGFSGGLPLALSGSTLLVWMREAGIDLDIIGLFALAGTPYTIKFLWAPIVDALDVPILSAWFGRRRGWLMFAQVWLMASIVLLGLCNPATVPWSIVLGGAILVASASATQDILIDAFRIESLPESEQAAGMASYVAAYRIGMLASTAGALFLVSGFEGLGLAKGTAWTAGYIAMAALVLVGMVTALIATEPEKSAVAETDHAEHDNESATARVIRTAIHAFADFLARMRPPPGGDGFEGSSPSASSADSPTEQGFALDGAPSSGFADAPREIASAPLAFIRWWQRNRIALVVLAFIVLFKFTDALAGIMTAPFVIDLGFSRNEYAAIIKGVGLAATLIGGFAGGFVARAFPLATSLWIGGLLQAAANLAFSWQAVVGHDLVMLTVAIVTENFTSAIGTVIFVAYLSALCNNPLHTATQYALLTALSAVGRTYLSSGAGFIAQWVGWVWFFAICAVAAVPSFGLLAWLQARGHFKALERANARTG